MRFFALFTIAFLASCSNQNPRGPLIINPIVKYENQAKAVHYGPWYIAENDSCRLVGGNQDFSVETAGQFERNTLRMKLISAVPLSRPPQIHINTLDAPILVEGRHRSYGFNLPFAAHEAAQYAVDHSYLFVTYQPLGNTSKREGFLALKPLLSGLGALARRCN